MDFVNIANEQQRLLRSLEQMLETASGSSGSTSSMTSVGDPSEIANHVGTKPLLSKSAEAELFLLATNFLLYVAMVIVVTIVCQIYFPEMLTRRAGAEDYQIRSRNVNYRVAQQKEGGDGILYEDYDETAPSDDDDEEDDDEILDSDSDDYLVQNQSRVSGGGGPNQPNFLEFQQESMPKSQVLKRLVFCSIMLNITFVTWGAIQVRQHFEKPVRRCILFDG
jgi:hypothetical protein